MSVQLTYEVSQALGKYTFIEHNKSVIFKTIIDNNFTKNMLIYIIIKTIETMDTGSRNCCIKVYQSAVRNSVTGFISPFRQQTEKATHLLQGKDSNVLACLSKTEA